MEFSLGVHMYVKSRAWIQARPSREPNEADKKWLQEAIPHLRSASADEAKQYCADAKYFLGLALCPSEEAKALLRSAMDSGKCAHAADARKRLENMMKK